MELVKGYGEQWECECPALVPDGGGGTLLLLEQEIVCPVCGGVGDTRMSWVHKGTRRKDLVSLGMGASVKHYWTTCRECLDTMVS